MGTTDWGWIITTLTGNPLKSPRANWEALKAVGRPALANFYRRSHGLFDLPELDDAADDLEMPRRPIQ